jgi:hypothetical protein
MGFGFLAFIFESVKKCGSGPIRNAAVRKTIDQFIVLSELAIAENLDISISQLLKDL